MVERVPPDLLAKAAAQEKWEIVDGVLHSSKTATFYLDSAINRWLNDSDENIRDLAGTVIEKARIPRSKFDALRPVLHDVISKDKGNYAGFRAACALAAHGVGEYRGEVKRVLTRFAKDKDVAIIAKSYLSKI